jgi:phosphotransferase system enzyme I (PtsI)
MTRYEVRRAGLLREAEEARRYLYAPPVMADGQRIEIGLNLGLEGGEDLSGTACADHVGLLRTEFLFMGAAALPDEEAQYRAYKKVLAAFAPGPVTLRTLDIGGDKTLPALPLPPEPNPALGHRGLRLCLARPALFRTQLRAALRASAHGSLWLMLPMVTNVEEIRRARALVAEVRGELLAGGVPVSGNIKVGVMIETPAAAVIADIIAAEADIASIGTNDLCQ